MKKVSIAVVLIIVALYSCTTSTSTKDPAVVLDSLQTTYKVINDSLSNAWKVMIDDDDLKLTYMKRLLQEVEFTNNFDKDTVDGLKQRVDAAMALRYDQQSMSDSDLIDEYDATVQNLISEISGYARSNPFYEKYPLMAELITDIQTADGRVLFHRVHYDDFAKLYNQFLSDNGDLLDQIDPNIRRSKYPLFQLSE